MEEILHRFSSATLGNERTIWIREAPDPSQPFHLAIFLDAELYRDRVGAVAIIKHLQSTARLANTLFGFVSMESVESRWKECPCHAPFADFLNGELVPWLEERYPPLTTASERVLIGLSYTGLAALFVASSPHSTFNRVIAQSGSFWWNHCFLTEKFRTSDRPVPAEIYLDVGSEETATNVLHKEDVLQVVSQLDAVRQLRDVLIGRGAKVSYLEFPGGHTSAEWQKSLPGALEWALPPGR
jgi:enterochelin esterase-like enzyme